MSARVMRVVLLAVAAHVAAAALVRANDETWRYYRVGNTGIQGDYNEAVWIGPDGDPYIGGYDPIFEEGGFAQFLQSENRWVNYSNVDLPVIGHPDSTGTARVSDIVADANGRLWMATGRGALFFDPAVGRASLVRYDRNNSAMPGGWTTDADIAPDGTVWFVGYSTYWGNGGLTRYDPSTGTWTHWEGGGSFLSVQPKSTGGYWVWTAESYHGYAWRFNSATGTWTLLPFTGTPGEVVGMPGKDCVDDAGNFWALRLRQPGAWEGLDYRTPSGTWVTPPAPYDGATFNIWAFKAYGNGQAVLADGNGAVWQFNGTSWSTLGVWRPGGFTEAIDADGAGNIWVSGTGGAAKWIASSGQWQRYRITNTGHFDDFTRDLTLDAATGDVYAGANAGPGVGGMTRFDGQRWTGWNNSTYGLGFDWPFQNDNCTSLAWRASTGGVAVSPLNWLYGVHEWDGSAFTQIPPLNGAQRMCEDSQGRLWALGEYYNLNVHDGTSWTSVPLAGWGSTIRPDPSRLGTVWAATGYEVVRTDGAYRFSRTVDDFPELAVNSDYFRGVAPDANGIAWIGCTVQYGLGGPGGGLIRLDTNTGAYQMLRYDEGWPFPGEYVTPWAVTPDGRLWMQYDSAYPSTANGLCWYDGTNVGQFPAPPGGIPQWGGLPHQQIEDLEVRPLANGYELWMSCVSRGIAVLSVPAAPVAVEPPSSRPLVLALEQNAPNPFGSSTKLAFTVPRAGHVRFGVYNSDGRLVRMLVDGDTPAGRHEIVWDAKDANGRSVGNGVYYGSMRYAERTLTQRLLVLR